MNQAEYANHRGVSRMTATHWKRAGLLVFKVDGNIDVAATDAKLDAHGVKDKRVKRSAPVKPVEPAPVTTPVKEPPAETIEQEAERLAPENPFETRAGAERVKETYLALLRKLEFDEKSGEVVKIAAVAKQVGEQYARVRSRLMSIPAEVAPTIAAFKTAEEVRDYLEREITEALKELSADDGRAGS